MFNPHLKEEKHVLKNYLFDYNINVVVLYIYI